MSEKHLFILWEKARHKEKEIIDEIKKQFEILKEYEIEWEESKFERNLNVLYGHNIFDEEIIYLDRGIGKFLCIIIQDNNPRYENVNTLRGIEIVNSNIYNLKIKLRDKFCDGRFSIHATQTIKEFKHDFAVIFHKTFNDFIQRNPGQGRELLKQNTVSVEGWKSLKQVFYILNETINYVILRNYENLPESYKLDEHEDIDILVEDVQEFCHLIQPENNLRENAIPLSCFVKVGTDVIPFHKKFVLDGYYDYKFEKKLLQTKVLNENNIYVPNKEELFYSLAYHAYFHKPKISKTYITKLRLLSSELFNQDFLPAKKDIRDWMKKNHYKDSICVDCLLNNQNQVKNVIKFNPEQEEFYFYSSGVYGSLLFHKKMFSLNPKFLTLQLMNFTIFFDFEKHVLDRNHPLVKKYVNRVKKGEYLWFFKARYGKIMETAYYEDHKQNCFIKRKFLLNDLKTGNKYVDIIPDKKRPLYFGHSFQEELKEIDSFENLIAKLDYFILEVFTKYEDKRQDFLKPEAFDALPFNCIVDDRNNLHFIDNEFRLKGGISKSYYIWRLCRKEHTKIKDCFNRDELYQYLCKKYGLPNFKYGFEKLQECIHHYVCATPIEIFYDEHDYSLHDPLMYKENLFKKKNWQNKNKWALLKISIIKIISSLILEKNIRKRIRQNWIMKYVFPYQELYELYFALSNKQKYK